MAKKTITRQISIFINGKQVKNSVGAIGREISKVKKKLKEATDPEDIKKYNKELANLEKAFGKANNRVKRNVSFLKKLRKELGLTGITIAAIFSVSSMVNYFKTLREKVNVLRDLKHTISQITDLEGKELDQVTSKVKSLADAFEEDSKKMTESANALSKQMGIDFTSALDLIEQGFLKGANANGDFLDKVREYPALLQEAGLSAKQTIALMQQEVKKGIYSDKGVDAIKEANLRLREMTPAASGALNAIGLSSKNIEADLSSGRKTIFQVIQEISKRLSTLPPQSKLAGQAIADIFGGPGEDAGLKYLSTLHEIDLSLAETAEGTDEMTEAKRLEIEANESLNNIMVQLTGTASTLNLIYNKLKLEVAEAISFFAQLIGITEDTDGSMDGLRQRIAFVTKLILVGVTAVVSYNAALRLMSLWTKVATGDTILHSIALKANAVGLRIARGAKLLYIAATALFTGNLKRATLAMKVFNRVTKLNPVGLLIAAVMGLIAAYKLFSKATGEAAIKQQALNEVKKRTASIYGKEEGSLKKLLSVARDEKLSREERLKAIKEINAKYPKYLGNLTLENINSIEAAEAIDKHVESMKKRAEQKALEQLIDETIKKRREEEAKGLNEEVKWYDYLTTAFTSFGNSQVASMQMTEKAFKRRQKNLDELTTKENAFIEKYKKNIEIQQKEDEKLLENDKKFKRIRAQLEETARKLRIKNIEKLTNQQLRMEIGKAIERNNKIAALNKKAAEKEAEERRKRLIKEQEYRDKVILGNKDLIVQEIAAHNQRLKNAGIFGKKRADLTANELLALEALEFKHNANLTKIEIDATNKHLSGLKRKYISEKTLRQIAFNNELLAINDLETAKTELRKFVSEEELVKIDTLEKAKSVLRRKHQADELQKQGEYLQSLVDLYTAALNNGEIEGVSFADKILTEEQKQLLNDQLEQVRLKLSEIGIEKKKLAGQDEDADLSALDDIDIFGSTPDQWQKAFDNLDTAKGKIEALGAVLGGLQNAWSLYSDFVAANEAKQLRTLERSNESKKATLKNQLDSGLIDQKEYNEEVEKLDKNLDRAKAEIEYKQAKREKIGALFGVASNTALGIMKAVAASPLTGGMPWAAIIGGMGLAQAALIAAKPMPDRGFFDGGFTGNKALYHDGQDGVAGAVHVGEWVAPKWMNEDPRYAPIIQHLENERSKGSNKGFFDGGHTSETPSPEFEEAASQVPQTNEGYAQMIALLQKLDAKLDQGFKGYLVDDYEEYLRRRERDEEHQQILENTRQS